MFTISRRLVINAWRKRMSDPRYITYLEVQEQIEDSNRTEHAVEYDDFSRRMNDMIGELPPTQRKIVRYAKMEEMPNKEIAARMGLSEQTVRNQLSLALKTLRSRMGEERILLGLLFFFYMS